MDMNMSMSMFFTVDFPHYFLLKSWILDSTNNQIYACVGTFGLAIIYELLKDVRLMWNKGYFSGDITRRLENDPGTGDCCADADDNFSTFTKGFWCRHIFQSLLHIIQVFIAFILMLIVMSYNYWLLVSLCVGNGIGYFFAGLVRYCVVSSLKNQIKKRRKKDNSQADDSLEETDVDSLNYYNSMSMPKYPNGGRSQQQIHLPNQQHHASGKVPRAGTVVYDNYAMSSNFNY